VTDSNSFLITFVLKEGGKKQMKILSTCIHLIGMTEGEIINIFFKNNQSHLIYVFWLINEKEVTCDLLPSSNLKD